MWLIALLVPLLPTIFMVSSHYPLAWALRLVGGGACVKSTHAFVFSNCTHGKVDSVLETFDLYAETHQSLCIGSQIENKACCSCGCLWVLELGMHCGYSSVHLLCLLPPGGRLMSEKLDQVTADLGEEIILVAGFKHSQFQVLASHIPALNSFLESYQGTSDGINLVLIDHDLQQNRKVAGSSPGSDNLLALEREELRCPSGCTVLGILDHIRGRVDSYCIKTEDPFIMEIFLP
ncbi:mitochondrial import receptor subunit TOM20 [Sarotherodon galilaeus]